MERTTLPADITAALERARFQVESLARTADELQNVLPDAVGTALREGLREEAAPIARRVAEVKGLVNGTARRLERLDRIEARLAPRRGDVVPLRPADSR